MIKNGFSYKSKKIRVWRIFRVVFSSWNEIVGFRNLKIVTLATEKHAFKKSCFQNETASKEELGKIWSHIDSLALSSSTHLFFKLYDACIPSRNTGVSSSELLSFFQKRRKKNLLFLWLERSHRLARKRESYRTLQATINMWSDFVVELFL